MKPLFRVPLGLLGIAFAVYAMLRVVVFAYADYAIDTDSLPDLERAATVAPANAFLHGRIATVEPARASELDAAIALNPRNPSWWVMRSIDQEETGDVAGAEKSLRRAVQVANYFVPWWSMASFYYRQENEPAFLASARSALAVGDSDAESLFRMASNMKIPAAVVERQILPDRVSTVKTWLTHTEEEHDWDAATRAGERLGKMQCEDCASQIMDLCDLLIRAGQASDAVRVWNAMSAAHWIPQSRLNPDAGVSLTDGGLSLSRIDRAFDWRLGSPGGVETVRVPGEGVRFGFDGNEPESCELLTQFVPLVSGRHYRLTTRFRTENVLPGSGIRWSFFDDRVKFAESPDLSPPDPSGNKPVERSVEFEAPRRDGIAKLVLMYERQLGRVRISGRFWLESVRLDLLPAVQP